MPRKNQKEFILNDDRPSRFLLDLKMPPKVEPQEPEKERGIFDFFTDDNGAEVIQYTEPKRFTSEETKPTKKKRKKEKKLITTHSFSYRLKKVLFIRPKRTLKKTLFKIQHYFYQRRAAQIATPGARALHNSSFENLNHEFKKFTRKKALAFVTVMFLLILPLKGLSYLKSIYDLRGRVLGASEEAASELKGGAKQAVVMNFDEAVSNFSRASDKFLDARNEIGAFSKLLSVLGSVIPNDDIRLAKNATLILDSGRISADIGQELTMAFSTLEPDKEKNIKVILESFYTHTKNAALLAHELHAKVEKIEVEYLPEEYQGQFTELQQKSGTIANGLDELVILIEDMKNFLGFQYDKRYLLVFQNNTELRASGGFIGSYALIDFRNGEITNLEVPSGGSYDTEAGLKTKIAAPYALQLVNPLWHFWDANWWPDWPTTARKLMWFYEESDGPTVDGVISFTPTVFEKILAAIGPIDMTKGYDVVLDADNFWLETQRITEAKNLVATSSATSTMVIDTKITSSTASSTLAQDDDKPKKIIGDLMGKIIEEMPKRLNKEVFMNLVGVIEDSLNEKHVMFYLSDPELQSKSHEYGWDGAMKNTAFDYLMVVNTNVAGGKTDRVIRETISHEAEIQKDGSIIDTVTIKREHTGEKWQEFTGVRNNDWLRVYVPLGSELISYEGFSTPEAKFFSAPDSAWGEDELLEKTEAKAKIDPETGTRVYAENGKTVFANWSQIDPGQTAELVIRYRLPFKIEKIERPDTWQNRLGALLNPGQKDLTPYALLVQKQPGTIGANFYSSLRTAPNMSTEWHYLDDANNNQHGWVYAGDLKIDRYQAVLINIK